MASWLPSASLPDLSQYFIRQWTVGAVFARLDQIIEFVRMIRQLVGLQDNQLASTWDYRGMTFESLVGESPKTAFGLA